jgi:GNAT superfamily N-acetyltransferase
MTPRFFLLEERILMNGKLAIREMTEQDCPIIANAFTAQGWDKPLSQYLGYWQEHCTGARLVLVAELEGQFAGYVTIVWVSDYPPFHEAGIPEIVDFNVLKKYQRRHVGTALMDQAEQRISARSRVAGLGVCIFVDYGPAQVLYARRGYVPDGRGVFQAGHYPLYGAQVRIDDDLVLYMTKRLRDE